MKPARHAGIDLLRGIVMLLMVIDHARDYSAAPGSPGDPMDLTVVGPALFFTRWISHFCAPVFALLMGVSVHFSARSRTPQELSRHLAMRGLLLLLLEFTLVDWGWTWNPFWPRKFFQVIAALACSLCGLAIFTRLGRIPTLAVGALILVLHNLTDGIRFADGTALHYLWSFIHQRNVLPLFSGFEVRTSYPFLPVMGVAFLGYSLAPWIAEGNRAVRTLGASLLAAFLILRVAGYGDPHPMQLSESWSASLMSLLNVTKYPLSLQFVCITLGPALLFLHWTRKRTFPRLNPVATLGRSPLLFYVSHLWLLHAIFIAGALVMGYPASSIDLTTQFGGRPPGFTFPLWLVFPFAAFTAALLLPLCRYWTSAGTAEP